MATDLSHSVLNASEEVIENPCSICKVRDKKDVESINYCVDCDSNICSICTDFHANYPPLMSHKVVNISKASSARKTRVQLPTQRWALHNHKLIERYCVDHQQLACDSCVTQDHSCLKMSGIRVRRIPKTVSEKHLKIHFSKPSNGGGTILNIYFPLFNNDAVIMFENHTVVDHVISKPHQLHDQEVEVECLPEHMIFVSMEVKLDTNAAVLLQESRNLVDEMQFDKEINVIEDTDQTVRLRGNWFQLEWAWHYLDCFMQQQEIIQSKIPQPDVPQVQPMEIEEDTMRAPLRRSLSPSDVNPVSDSP